MGIEPEPRPAALLQKFGDDYFHGGAYQDYLALEAAGRRQAKGYLRLLTRWLPAKGRLLDIGCAAGFLLAEAISAGWSASGVEPSPEMALSARERFGADVMVGDVDALLPERDSADAVTLLNVFEHLVAPRAVASRLAELVRTGGVLFIETWNVNSLAARLLGRRWHQWSHLVPYYYSRRALQSLFRDKFTELSWRPALKWITVARALEIAAPRRRVGRSALSRMLLPYVAGDLVLSVWRRR